jgi:hypothetical protein
MALQKIQSPKGSLEYVTITGEGKENLSGRLQYVANIVCDPKEPAVAAFIKSIDDFWADNRPKTVKEPKSTGVYQKFEKTDETDADGVAIKKDTGLVYFAFKTGTTFPDGSTKKVKTYNSKAKAVALGDIKIGNGTIGHVAGAMDVYLTKSKAGQVIDAGVTLYLDAIQILKLVEYTGGDAGFTADDSEEGWTGDEGWTGEEASDEAPKAGPRL